MVTLREIMTRDVITVSPDISIRDAMSLLSTKHISGVPVVAGGEIVGVVTSTDLMGFAADQPGAPAERTHNVEQGELADREEMEGDGRELEPPGTYFTELWEDSGADAAVRFNTPAGPEWNVLDAHTVQEAMTHAPIWSLPGDTALPRAADFMRAHAIHRILIVDGKQLVGIVTSTDVANAVADHKLFEREWVFPDSGRHAHTEHTLGERLPRKDMTEQGKP